MKLLIFSCLVALALARPEALDFSVDRRIKHQEVENRLNEDIIPVREVSSSEESFQQPIKIRYPLEEQVLYKPREALKALSNEEAVTSSTKDRVRRQAEYIIEDASSASIERKIEDAREYYAQHLRRLEEPRALHYQEPRSFPTESRKLQAYREAYVQPEIYYYVVPVPQVMAYPDEVPFGYAYKFPVPTINRATEAGFTPAEEERN